MKQLVKTIVTIEIYEPAPENGAAYDNSEVWEQIAEHATLLEHIIPNSIITVDMKGPHEVTTEDAEFTANDFSGSHEEVVRAWGHFDDTAEEATPCTQ